MGRCIVWPKTNLFNEYSIINVLKFEGRKDISMCLAFDFYNGNLLVESLVSSIRNFSALFLSHTGQQSHHQFFQKVRFIQYSCWKEWANILPSHFLHTVQTFSTILFIHIRFFYYPPNTIVSHNFSHLSTVVSILAAGQLDFSSFVYLPFHLKNT